MAKETAAESKGSSKSSSKSVGKSARKNADKNPQETPPQSVPVAVFVTGGKQYRVSPGDLVNVDSVGYEVGADITFNDVVFFGKSGDEGTYKVGTGTKSVGAVRAKVVALKKAPKVIIFKKRLKGGYTKKQGHRQQYAQVRIEDISAV